MNKKIIISIVLIVFIGVCIILFWHHLEGKENLINNDSNDNKNEKDNTNKSNIVIYFSETGKFCFIQKDGSGYPFRENPSPS